MNINFYQLGDLLRKNAILLLFSILVGCGGGDDSGGDSNNGPTILPPVGVAAKATSATEIVVTWDPITGATTYVVHGANGGATNMTTKEITALSPGTEYCYTVTARNIAGNESKHSEKACATTRDSGLEPPSNVKAKATSSTEIELTWDAVSGAKDYGVYKSGNRLGYATRNSTRIVSVTPGTRNCYTVTTRDSAGKESKQSEEACATTPGGGGGGGLEPPSNLKAKATSSTEIELTWDKVSSAKDYGVYKSGSRLGYATSNGVRIVNVTPGTRYCYTVTTRDSAGNESKHSEEACATTTNPPLASLSRPTGLTVQVTSSTTVNISWYSVSGAYGYKLYKKGAVVHETQVTTVQGRNFTPGKKYCFSVTAFDYSKRESLHSLETCVTMPNSSSTQLKMLAERVKYGHFSLGNFTVSGLQYAFGNENGVTNSEGTFQYEDGKKLKFFISDILLSELAKGKSTITPLDFVSGPINSKVINISRFLLTLDEDANPLNGILIPAAARTITGIPVDFDSDAAFEEMAPEFIGRVTNTSNLVSRETALRYLEQKTFELFDGGTGVSTTAVEEGRSEKYQESSQ